MPRLPLLLGIVMIDAVSVSSEALPDPNHAWIANRVWLTGGRESLGSTPQNLHIAYMTHK